MRLSRLLLIGTLLLLLLGACSLLVPGYDETKAQLAAATAEAHAAREAVQQQIADAKKAGDLAALADGVAKLPEAFAHELDAREAQAKHEVDSAAAAGGSVLGEVLSGGAGLAGLIASFLAQSKATKVATGPSRAQPELDELYDSHNDLKAELAELKGKLSSALAVQPIAATAELKAGAAA